MNKTTPKGGFLFFRSEHQAFRLNAHELKNKNASPSLAFVHCDSRLAQSRSTELIWSDNRKNKRPQLLPKSFEDTIDTILKSAESPIEFKIRVLILPFLI
jgi:hypothetical protein